MSPSLFCSAKSNVTLISLLLSILRHVELLGLNMAISCLKDPAVVLASFPMTLIRCVEAKPRVSSD
jgi:hypothetical protein